MDDLIAWLLEQVAVDEHRINRVATGARGPWRYDREPFQLNELDEHGEVRFNLASRSDYGKQPLFDVVGEYMENFQPQRMLAECEAKRRMISEHGPETNDVGWDRTETICRRCRYDEGLDSFPHGHCPTIKLLAASYADRPGYQESWRPA